MRTLLLAGLTLALASQQEQQPEGRCSSGAECASTSAAEHFEALEARVARLEVENARLRDRLAAPSAPGVAAATIDTGRLHYKPTKFNFALVSDLDKASRDPKKLVWRALLQHGTLSFHPTAGSGGSPWRIRWGATEKLESTLAVKNRSLELSELVRYNGQLLAVCDITGIVYEVDLAKRKAYQRWALGDGDGFNTKPFKSEWATVKDGALLIGSMGREWVAEDGSIEHFNNQWVKTIDANGRVSSVNWRPVYEALRAATNTTLPGYLWHEAVEWDPRTRRWLVLPRKASENEPYTPESDETRGTNLLLVASEDFSTIEVRHLGPMEPEWGFSAIRKVPGSDSVYLALKVLEVDGRTASRIALFDLSGPGGAPRMLLDPPLQPVGGDPGDADAKYEGLDFLNDG